MKNKICLFLSTICTLLLMSCVNLVGDDNSGVDSSGGKCTITGTITLSEASRTAVPDLEIADYFYEVKATNDAVPPEEVDGIVDAVHHTFSITLADGNWDITVNGYQSQVGDVFSNKLFTTTNSIVVANNGVSAGSLTFKLKMIQTPANPASSTVELPIKVDSSITDVEAIWQESGVEKKQTIITNGAQTTANFTMKADGASSNTATSGNYPVVFKFYSTVNGVKVLCYSLVETVALYDYLPTNFWLNNTNAPYITLGIMNITSNILRNFDYEEFYVSSTGNNKNSGGFFDPFASVQSAVSIVQAIAKPEVEQYTIYLKDNITLASDYTDWPMQSDGVTPEDSYVTINPSSSLKIKITSYGEPATPYKIDANRSAANPGRVMYVGEKAEVTLENITITGGCSNINGAGVFINSGTLTMNEKASITQNYFAIGGKSGAGVYSEYGTVIMNTGAEISYNGNTTNLANGGGLYLKGSDTDLTKKAVIKMEPGSKIHHNVGYSGAGIKGLFCSDCYIHGAEITDNEAVYTTNDNGGGVWASVLSGNVLEIKDTSLINNTVNCGTTGGGGALYVHSGTVLLNGTTLFENNSGVTGNAIRIQNTKDQNVILADSVKFDNTTVKQTIAYDYSSATGTPYIKLGKLTGAVADQTVYLTISPLTEGNPVLVPNSAAVNIADYADRFIVLNSDLTPSNYEIDDEGKLKSNIVIGPNGGNASSAYEDVVPFGDGTGITTAGNYSISTKEELTAFATWATSYTSTNYTFVLYDNIDLEGVPFSPIGGTKAFGGTFDGNGNKIKNLKINSASGNAALFGKVGANATVKNLYVHGEVKGGGTNVAGIVSEISVNTGRIDNCVSDVTVSTSSGSSVGGICGSAKGMITNCVNIGSVTGSASGINVGGICGSAELSVYNSANFGTISGFSSVGGIVGTLTSYQTISNCYNYGVISSAQTNNRGAIEGNGTLTCVFADLYYHANSSVSKAIAGDNYPSVGETFTDPDALRSTLNTNLMNPAYSTLSLAEWNYDYKINGVKFPVCTTFVLPEKSNNNIADLNAAPTSGTFNVNTLSDISKIAGWVTAGVSMESVTLTLDDDLNITEGLWTPIGDSTHPFKGTFDGGGFDLTGVIIQGGSENALFGFVEDAEIKNIKITGSISNAGDNVGGLVGKCAGVTVIENCVIDMVVNSSGSECVGGIVGYVDDNGFNQNIIIKNCHVLKGVAGKNKVGGIVGYISANPASVSILNCSIYGQISGTDGVGGIVGYSDNTYTRIENCFVQGDVQGSTNTGAIAGYVDPGNAANLICYSYAFQNNGSSVTLFGETVGGKLESTCMPFEYSNAGTQTICVLSGSSSDLVADVLNLWCTTKSTGAVTYTKWKYITTSGEIGFETE